MARKLDEEQRRTMKAEVRIQMLFSFGQEVENEEHESFVTSL